MKNLVEIGLLPQERYLISEIFNFNLKNITLKQHIALEAIMKKLLIDEIDFPSLDSLKESKNFTDEDIEMYLKYPPGTKLADVESVEDRECIRKIYRAMQELESDFWQSEDESLVKKIEFTKDEIEMIKKSYESDEKTFPDITHKAIISLHTKITNI